jgi:tRNA 2-thiouridine synthesizing protein A
MPHVVDARGLTCPLPTIKARQALAALEPGATLVVLATDPEAPLDLAALAADGGHGFSQVPPAREGAGWRLTLVKAAAP